mmetsp:Transcript_6674/g.10552  ORF Transcript_6674/g.10552 Transcript_6674/m.10552 type:complete len:144 (-) Transcript_6674:325-756(-)
MHGLYAGLASQQYSTLACLIGVQDFAKAVRDSTFEARIKTIPGPFALEAKRSGGPVDSAVVERVWKKITPGILEFELPVLLKELGAEKQGFYVGQGAKDPRNPIQYVKEAAEGCPGVSLVIDEAAAHEVSDLLWTRLLSFLSH